MLYINELDEPKSSLLGRKRVKHIAQIYHEVCTALCFSINYKSMKAVKIAPASKSQKFILTIKKLRRFGKSLSKYTPLTDGEDHRTCHSCIPEAPKSTTKPWAEKLVEAP